MRVRLLMVVATVSCAAACVQDEPVPEGLSDQQIIVDFADQVVVATYALLADRITALGAAVDALAADPTEDNLAAARLSTYPDPPHCRIWRMYSSFSCMVRIRTLVCGLCCLICRVASSPVMLGIAISINTTSGLRLRALATVSRPSDASPTT